MRSIVFILYNICMMYALYVCLSVMFGFICVLICVVDLVARFK